MKIYKYTMFAFGVVSLLFLALSWMFYDSSNLTSVWFSNICAGVFASSILLVGTSFIGYLVEEKKKCTEYYWKLVSLRGKVVVLSTLPTPTALYEDYYHAISEINELLVGYFAMFENEFIFYKKRKRIQKLIEIHNMLYELKNLSINAELYFRQYIAETKDNEGQRTYKLEKFRKDISDFVSFIDDYEGEGHFVLKLDEKIMEYNSLIK